MPSSLQSSLHTFTFGPFELDEASLTFRRDGEAIALPIKPWSALLLLVQSAPDTVSKNELIEVVWPGRVVTDGVLSQVISRLRAVLGDEQQEIIKSLYGIGFRLTLPVLRQVRPDSVSAPSADTHLLAGKTVRARPQWTLLRPLSTSKRTAVWLAAHDNGVDQRVFKFAHDGSGLRSLKREYSVTRVLQAAETADGMVEVIDTDFSAEPFFVSLPYFRSGNLVDYVEANSGLTKYQKLDLLTFIAETLSRCHAAGVIHGDVKPKNILVEGSHAPQVSAKLADFGAALLTNHEQLKSLELSALHQTGTVTSDPGSGTLAYAAPELLTGKPVSTASDAYAFGVTAFQLLCGEFSRPLSPGWEELIDDPLLRLDIAELCHANPAKRPSLSEAAWRLSSLEARTEAAIIREQEAAELERVRADSIKREQERDLDMARIDYLTRRRRLLRGVAAGLAGLLALASTGFVVARKQTALAQINAQEAKRYQLRAEIVQKTLFTELVNSVNPYEKGNVNAKVVDSLGRISDSIAKELTNEPVFAAEMLRTLSASLTVTGQQQHGEQALRTALSLVVNKDPVLAADICNRLGDGLRLQGRQIEAIAFYRQGFGNWASTSKVRSALGLADSLNQIGISKEAQHYLDIADQGIAASEKVQPTVRMAAWSLRGGVLARMGNLDAAQAQYQKVVDYAAKESSFGNPVQSGLRGLAKINFMRGNPQQAIEQQLRALAQIDLKMPHSLPALNARFELAQYYVSSKNFEVARRILEELLAPKPGMPMLNMEYKSMAQVEMAKVQLYYRQPQLALQLLAEAKPNVLIALSKDSNLYRELEALTQSILSQSSIS
jgi:serine/threonine protein kinase/DNA-binding winged helix-turn-helix (wHTH) protein